MAISVRTGAGALEEAVSGGRLGRDEILSLYTLPPAEVAAAAHEVRLRRADPSLVTYSIGGNVATRTSASSPAPALRDPFYNIVDEPELEGGEVNVG